MPVQRLKKYLEESHIEYDAIHHAPAYTAQEIAAASHVKGKELAKTVVVKLDGELVLAVLPASARIDLELLKSTLGAEEAELAREEDFRGKFPGCEVGAMPPFGNLYGMKTFVSEELARDEQIAFNAGSHIELIRMDYRDFDRLVGATVLSFAATA
jgi:Ala-tRNA(Pro) deacylase